MARLTPTGQQRATTAGNSESAIAATTVNTGEWRLNEIEEEQESNVISEYFLENSDLSLEAWRVGV